MSKSQTSTIQDLPAALLRPATNIRKDILREDVEAFKSSLLATGLLQNLIAVPQKEGRKTVYAVFVGFTRLMAIHELIAEGKFDADYKVPVMVRDDIDLDSPEAIAMALAENIIRKEMNYIDECAAMNLLAQAKKTEAEIAAIFGYKPRTVVERLLIASLIPEAHRLVRDKVRGLDWARALTSADKAMQKQICDDIATHPDSWKTGDDIRKFLSQATVPASNALFDLADYTGGVLHDLFDGDKLSDLTAFWTLQNAAISDLCAEVEAEGFQEVVVLREPFQEWRYEDCPVPADSLAFIEVLPNGKVNVIRGKKLLASETDKITSITLGEADQHILDAEEIADHEVRVTPSIAEYAAAQRSAMLQAKIAGNFRAALEYSVMSMLGHRITSLSVPLRDLPGTPAMQSTTPFRPISQISSEIRAIAADAPTPVERDAMIVAHVKALSDDDLQDLFSKLTSQRVVQTKTRIVDVNEQALTNVFGRDIDIRKHWTPNDTFFQIMSSEDLRRLTVALIPGLLISKIAGMKKKTLVKMLASNFENARNGTMKDTALAAALNAWVPGVMSFPAHVVTKGELEAMFEADDENQDLDAMLFGDVA